MKFESPPIKVCDMRTLELEKARLRKLCRSIEREMGGRVRYAKRNYFLLALSSLFPGIRKEKSPFKWVLQIAKGAWESGHLQSILLSALVALAEFIGVRLGTKFMANFFSNLKKEKQEKKDSEK